MDTIQINRSESIPIHTQLLEQLRYPIESGAWEPGRRLPTVRELAQALRINYNTVRQAYQDLERRGYIVTVQGRGTFVAEDPPRSPEDLRTSLLDLIDEALIKARQLGITPDDFAQTAYARAKLFPQAEPAVRLLFAECNQADLEYYARNITQATAVQPEIYLVDDLRAQDRKFFAQFDLVATTLFHVAEIQALVGPEQTVFGLMVKPDYLEVLAEISRMPAGARVGLVCAEQRGVEAMERSILAAGATYLKFITAGVDRPDRLQEVFQGADQVYVSRLALHQQPDHWPAGKPFRAYVDDLDDGALRMLRRQIMQIHYAKMS
jgi:DNA-binding transcriptional regulator YhcF (GntR family)